MALDKEEQHPPQEHILPLTLPLWGPSEPFGEESQNHPPKQESQKGAAKKKRTKKGILRKIRSLGKKKEPTALENKENNQAAAAAAATCIHEGSPNGPRKRTNAQKFDSPSPAKPKIRMRMSPPTGGSCNDTLFALSNDVVEQGGIKRFANRRPASTTNEDGGSEEKKDETKPRNPQDSGPCCSPQSDPAQTDNDKIMEAPASPSRHGSYVDFDITSQLTPLPSIDAPPLSPFTPPSAAPAPLIVAAKKHGSDVRNRRGKRRGLTRFRPSTSNNASPKRLKEMELNPGDSSAPPMIFHLNADKDETTDGSSRMFLGIIDIPTSDRMDSDSTISPPSSSSSDEKDFSDQFYDGNTSDDSLSDKTLHVPRPPPSATPAEKTKYYWELCYGKQPPKLPPIHSTSSNIPRPNLSASRMLPTKSCLSSSKKYAPALRKSSSRSTPTLSDRFKFDPGNLKQIIPDVRIASSPGFREYDLATMSTPTETRNIEHQTSEEKRIVKFGLPSAAEFDFNQPTIQLTPLPSDFVRERFPVEEKVESPEEEEFHRETARNAAVLAAWEDDFDSYLEDEDQSHAVEAEDPSLASMVVATRNMMRDTNASDITMNCSPASSEKKRRRRKSHKRRSGREDRRSSSFFSKNGRSLLGNDNDEEEENLSVSFEHDSPTVLESIQSTEIVSEAPMQITEGASMESGKSDITSPIALPSESNVYQSPPLEKVRFSTDNKETPLTDRSSSTALLLSIQSASEPRRNIDSDKLIPNHLESALERYTEVTTEHPNSSLGGIEDVLSLLISEPGMEREWETGTLFHNMICATNSIASSSLIARYIQSKCDSAGDINNSILSIRALIATESALVSHVICNMDNRSDSQYLAMCEIEAHFLKNSRADENVMASILDKQCTMFMVEHKSPHDAPSFRPKGNLTDLAKATGETVSHEITVIEQKVAKSLTEYIGLWEEEVARDLENVDSAILMDSTSKQRLKCQLPYEKITKTARLRRKTQIQEDIAVQKQMIDELTSSIDTAHLRKEYFLKQKELHAEQYHLEAEAPIPLVHCQTLSGLLPFSIYSLSDEFLELSFPHFDGSRTLMTWKTSEFAAAEEDILMHKCNENNTIAVHQFVSFNVVDNPDSNIALRSSAAAHFQRALLSDCFQVEMSTGETKTSKAETLIARHLARCLDVQEVVEIVSDMLFRIDLAAQDVRSVERDYKCEFQINPEENVAAAFIVTIEDQECTWILDFSFEQLAVIPFLSDVRISVTKGEPSISPEILNDLAHQMIGSILTHSAPFPVKEICSEIANRIKQS
uniref:Spc7 kinetochore protein domain-containing protein n=1 Tax=Attheya septentrionalis TaxID=420275 RepID=A0A7S2U9Z1_9STRA|mmetsp:Transcript_14168/g.25675  ORF Transcript_14168/g.25675 Transcript_14168/m.25675 type:complete len:1293 (+) Transcript_14168:337-4215(+)|eukprot:CAMPEP_0198286742 /NCGR_PEP_ID=MMETSP1449-20131203/5718_1 /TAXON_ID=420275 /ORGANISM="Attheya septentrionalis, Strain CCMP2084" /LENGTH=1292 /DNA_ID=CAMNT_0043984527 /DNA_START=279 /DNA_END=4157 /DNA_ORIENTATION=+